MRPQIKSSRIALGLLLALPASIGACTGSEDNSLTPGTGGALVGSGGVIAPASGGIVNSGGASAGGTLVATGGAVPNTGGDAGVGGSGGTIGATGGDAGAGGAAVGGAAPVGGGAGTGGEGGTTSPDITVQLADVRQLIRGFGINNNWAAVGSDAATLFKNGTDQLGLNILRVGMATTGEPYNGSSCYSDIDALYAEGQARSEPTYVMATLWSPPANCKSNNNINNGGYLLESCYESWSTTIASFADKIAQNTNTTLYAMSPQNEADFASCQFDEPCNGSYDTTTMTAKQAVAFQKIVGPKLRAKGVKPMSPEASEWIHVWSNISATGSEPSGLPSSDPLDCGCFSNEITPEVEATCAQKCKDGDGYDYGHALYADSAAWAGFDIMGTHEYDSQRAYAWPEDVPKGDKEVWQTEMSGVKWWPEQGPSSTIENGVAVARWIHSGLVVGEANAWLYWWFKAIGTDDNEGLLLKNSSAKTKRFYTFGQFSKFVRPNYHRVNMTGVIPEKVLLSAYVSDDGTVVIVAINETTTAQSLPITIAGGTAPATLTPYVTSATDNIAAKTAVTVTAGKFDAALPAMSVTTFVGK